MSTLRVGAVAWKLRRVRSDGEFFAHLFDFVESAHRQGVEVLVFPELFVLELLSLEPGLAEKDVPKYLIQYDEVIQDWVARISKSSGLTLVAGSQFRENGEGILNTCVIGHPEYGLVRGDKNNLTAYERDVWRLRSGHGLARPHDHRLGVTICYDCEFPESGRSLAEEGVLVQCVPAFTETQQGFQRVRWCCQARAVENQNFVVHASLLGSLGREPVPQTYGSSAILCPSIEPFPANAVLDETPLNEEGMAVADLNFDDLARAREEGDVTNWKDRHRGDWTQIRQ